MIPFLDVQAPSEASPEECFVLGEWPQQIGRQRPSKFLALHTWTYRPSAGADDPGQMIRIDDAVAATFGDGVYCDLASTMADTHLAAGDDNLHLLPH